MSELEPVRGGAMTRAMRAVPKGEGPRWLRWALVRDGKIVREAVLSPDRALSLGSDVPCAGVHSTLAYCEDGEWRVRVRAGWTGRIGERAIEGEGERTIDGNARFVIGEHSVLFQLVDRPPVRLKPVLPASVRGGFFARADYWFTAFVSGSLMLHFAFVVLVLESDWPIEQSFEEQIRRVEAIYPEIEPPPEPETPQMTAPTTRDEVADRTVSDEPSDHPGDRSVRARRSDRVEATLSADDEARLAMQGVQLLLGGITRESSGIQDLIDGAGATPDQDTLLADMSGATIATTDPNQLRERRSECATCDEIGGLERLAPGHGPHGVNEGPPVEERIVVVPPRGPDIDPPIPPPPGCEGAIVARAVRVRMTAVQHCYERALLAEGPDVAGRIEIEMMVMPVGSVSGVHAAENTTGSEALAACTVRSLETIRLFGCTPDEPFEVRYPIVFSRPE